MNALSISNCLLDPSPGPHSCFVPNPDEWRASWIWLNSDVWPDRQSCRKTAFCDDCHPYTVALFRKVVDLPFTPDRITVWISADTRYRCSVNGVIVGRGPASVGGDYGNTKSPDWWFYDGFYLDPTLMKQCRNVIAAEVTLGPLVQTDYSMGQGGLLMEMLVEGSDGGTLTVCTDDSWRATVSRAAEKPGVYDALREFRGWTFSGFDDASWPEARLLGHANACAWNLLPAEIPQLTRQRIPPVDVRFPCPEFESRIDCPCAFLNQEKSVSVKPGCPIVFWLRFPRELTGYLELELEGAEGVRLDVDFQESAGMKGVTESFVLPDGLWTHETARLQAFEFVQVTVIFPGGTHCATPLKIKSITAVFTSFPVRHEGRFEASDSFLSSLWDAGRWTTRLCMQSCHLDSPVHQEGLGCTGDYMIEALAGYACFGEARLARKDILRTAYLLRQKNGKMFHTSYSLLWVWMIMDYWMYSADMKTVSEVMPVVHELLDLFASYVGQTGIITEAPNYMFMDWVNHAGFSLHHPPASIGQGYMSAFYYRALLYAAKLCKVCGESGKSTVYSQRAQSLSHAFNQRLWDENRGLYIDGLPGITKVKPGPWLPEDRPAISFTAHTNTAAVAAGIAEADKRREIMEAIMQDSSLPMVQPYFMHFVFEALVAAGLFEQYAFDQMHKWKALLDEHPGSLKEAWDFGDYSHAWSGTPTYQLSSRVLGISPRTPGFGEVSVSPRLGPLEYAAGAVPSPRGVFSISWKKDHQVLTGILRGPSGCVVHLGVNGIAPEDIHVSVNDRMVDVHRTEDGRLRWTLKKCEYHIVAGGST